MIVDKTYLRDGTLLILGYGLASLLVMRLFGTNEVMRFSWLLLGPAVFLTIRRGFNILILAISGVLIGAILQDVDFGESVGNACRYAVVLFSGAWAYRRTGGATLTFNCVADYLRLYGVGLLMALLAVSIYTAQVHLGFLPVGRDSYLHQAAGVVCGFVIAMLPLLIIREWPDVTWTRRSIWEGGVIIGLSVLVGQVVFLNWWNNSLGQVARGYWMFLFVTLAALRFGPSGTVVVILITGVQALAGALHGLGFFSDDIIKTHLSNFYFYMLSLSSDGALVAVLFMKGQRDQQTLMLRSAELERFNKELKRTNADLEQFAYLASHDLRQPLRMVTNYLAVIEKRLGPQLEEDLRTYFDFATGGAKKMDRLLTHLLDYSRTGKLGEIENVPIGESVADALLILTEAIHQADAKVLVEEKMPTITANRSDLVRLFQNLLSNSIKYRSPDRAPEIRIGSRRQENDYLVWVKDNGMGIDPEHHERAFQIFQRLVPKDSYEGVGIGLAICKKIVEHSGGKIWIVSEVGEGSTFFMTFPVPPETITAAN